jgi:DNA-binding LacI/PurR family transcriptional regulator
MSAKRVRTFQDPGKDASLPMVLTQPVRTSLVDQTVDLMRELITYQRWKDVLPGEEALRTKFGISRVTLRKALAELEEDGWITSGGRGQRHLITKDIQNPPPTGIVRGGVLWLSRLPALEHAWNTRIIGDEIRKALLNRNRKLAIQVQASLWHGDPAAHLARLTASTETTGWILHRASPAIQRWFEESQLHCVVLGPCHEGITLPSVALDYAAIGCHAASEASRLGHHHIGFVAFDRNSTGTSNTLLGLGSIASSVGRAGKVTVINDDGTANGLRRELALTMRGVDPPTLIMVTEAIQALPVAGILREMNLIVPGDVSLIVRDHEPYLERSIPEFSRYNFDWLRFGRAVATLLNEMIETGIRKPRQRTLAPVFIPGRTLARKRLD